MIRIAKITAPIGILLAFAGFAYSQIGMDVMGMRWQDVQPVATILQMAALFFLIIACLTILNEIFKDGSN